MVRFLPFHIGDGPHNMAADKVLLESAVAGTASLRFYGWLEATVSLGYFQPERLRRGDERLAKLPWVRRPTGGGALVHHHELTYALALPAELSRSAGWHAHASRGHGTGGKWLCRMHTMIARALTELGVSPATVKEEKPPPGLLCFQHFTPGDLVVGVAKVVGSAQRRQRGALLQHGAVLLATSPHAPELPGILELTGSSLATTEIISVLEKEFAAQTGWPLDKGDWTAAERQRIDTLVQIKYGQPAWNKKR
jgi:lipoate-protein ligase A